MNISAAFVAKTLHAVKKCRIHPSRADRNARTPSVNQRNRLVDATVSLPTTTHRINLAMHFQHHRNPPPKPWIQMLLTSALNTAACTSEQVTLCPEREAAPYKLTQQPQATSNQRIYLYIPKPELLCRENRPIPAILGDDRHLSYRSTVRASPHLTSDPIL